MPDVVKGKYQIVREIARSNDIVYEAIDNTFGRKIALKELNIAAGASGQARRDRIERFNREARAAGKLSHPNIVSVFDFGEENGRYFIAMEYLEGQSLRDAMQVRGAYPVFEALQIFYQILDALSYAHANKVVHRDVKPDNVHILPGGQAKLTDFGIARLGEEPALTSDGQVFGTPSYMSPEQIEGKNIDYRSDLFSAGVMLYEMLAGRKPFTGDSVISITYAIMHAEPPQLNGVPQGIEQVIRRALSKQPQMRQISADQMKMDLKNAEQTPAIFLPPGQTNMSGALNRTGASVGFGYHGSVPTNPGYGYGQQSTAYVSTPMPGYAPPMQSQPPQQGGLPWSWNGSAQNSPPQQAFAPQTQLQPGPPGNPHAPGGTGLPYPYASPPFPVAPQRPLIVLSPTAQTLLKVFASAVVLGTVIAITVMAVLNSYDRFDQNTREMRVVSLMKQGADAYARSDYNTAVSCFEQAENSRPSATDMPTIVTNLAYSYVKKARVARQSGNNSEAKADYEKALAALPDYQVAHQELADLLQQMGDTSGAQEQRSSSRDSSRSPVTAPPDKLDVSKAPPSSVIGQDPQQFVNDQRQRARQLIQEGDRLNANGDVSGATEKWTEAVGKAPGTPESDEANRRLFKDQSGGTDGGPPSQ